MKINCKTACGKSEQTMKIRYKKFGINHSEIKEKE